VSSEISAEEQARAGTERISVVAAAAVLGLSSAALLPLVFPWQGALAISSGVLAFALLPFVLWQLLPRGRQRPVALRPHSSGVIALALACVASSWLALIPIWGVHRGQVRVLNHGEQPFSVFVDGRLLARVEPSSGESTRAGVGLSLPSGQRALRVLSEPEGRELFRAAEQVWGGKPHLFAPASAGYCFQIERRNYGVGQDEPVQVEPLSGTTPFWVLPEGISWFTPNPEPGKFQTSGGSLACLRQLRCAN